MKKYLMLLVLTIMVIAVTACGTNEASNSTPATTPTEQQSQSDKMEVKEEVKEEKEEVKEEEKPTVEIDATASAQAGEAVDVTYNVVLVDNGDSLLEVVKAIRNETGLGLVDSKGLVDNIPSIVASSLTLVEAEALKVKLEEAGASIELQEAAAPVKTGIKVVLVENGEDLLEVVKVVKNETGLGLSDSKNLVDNIPSVIAEDITLEEAEALKAAIEASGAKVEIQQ